MDATGVRVCGVAAVAGGVTFGISMLTPLRGWMRPGVPLSVAAMVLGAAGLYHVTVARESGWVRGGLIVGAGGLGLGLVGMSGSALHVGPPADSIINTGEHLGLVFIGAGMAAWSVPVLRYRLLGVFSLGPPLLAITGLSGVVMVSAETFSRLERGPIPLVFSLGWLLLGAGLITHPAPSSFSRLPSRH